MSEDDGLFGRFMSRGERIRELKRMEQAAINESASERLSECGESSEGDETNADGHLVYDSYLAHQRYYDDYKHSDYPAIRFDFHAPHHSDATIWQDKSLGKGGIIWDAAFVLVEYLMSEVFMKFAAEGDCKVEVLELGAGTGLTSVCLARALEATSRMRNGNGTKINFLTTDLPDLMDLIRKNVEANPLDPDQTSVCLRHMPLTWGVDEEEAMKCANDSKPFDIIIGADIVASLYDPELLVETLSMLSSSRTKIYVSFKGRESIYHDRFEDALRRAFGTVSKALSPNLPSRNRNPGVGVIVASDKIQ